MYAVIRQWTGASELIDAMDSRRGEVEQLISGVPGFVAYHAVRAGDGLTSVTLCQDKAGTDESTRVAGQWVRENLPAVTLAAPRISEGEVFVSFGAGGSPSLGSRPGAERSRA